MRSCSVTLTRAAESFQEPQDGIHRKQGLRDVHDLHLCMRCERRPADDPAPTGGWAMG